VSINHEKNHRASPFFKGGLRGFIINKIISNYAKKNRLNPTVPEKKIWYEILSRKQTGYKFLRQHPIGAYIPDFYCRKLKLIIEIDGDSHTTQKKYDAIRSTYFEGRELSVIRFTNRDILSNIDGVKEYLYNKILQITPSIPL